MADDLSNLGAAAPQRFEQAQKSIDVKLLRELYPPQHAVKEASQDKDSVNLSPKAQGFAAAQRVAREALEGLKMTFSEQQKPFIESGKLEFQEEFENHDDFSANGTANLILSGVTGYIFNAFQLTRPEMTEEDLDYFLEEAKKGVGQGFGEARDYLEGLELFEGDIKEDAERAIDYVYEGFEAFIEAQREILRERKEAYAA